LTIGDMEEPMVIDLTSSLLADPDDNAVDVPAAKKIKIQKNKVLNTSDLRKEMLVKKVEEKFNGISCSIAKSSKMPDKNKNVIIVKDVKTNNASEKLLIEAKEQDDENKSKNNLKEMLDEPKTKVKNEKKVKESKDSTENPKILIEAPKIEEKIVKRSRRACRVYIFNDETDKTEKKLEKSKKEEKIPKGINGRRPFSLVQGVQYELGEGEGVGDTLEDEEEVKLIRNEKYVMDSFCREAGYLSEDEMFETPGTDKVVVKIRQKKRALTAKSKLTFEKMGDPEIIGCLWFSGKGQRKELKKWTGIVLVPTTPIPTSFSTPPCQPLAPACPSPAPPPTPVMVNIPRTLEEDYAWKYAVKYYVKGRMRGLATTNTTSTPMVGHTPSRLGHSWNPATPTPAQIISQIKKEGVVGKSDVVNKYVYKYYFKYKNGEF